MYTLSAASANSAYDLRIAFTINGFACKRESDAHSLAALFLIDSPTPIFVLRASRIEALVASQIKCRRSRVSLRRGGGTYTHVCASHSEATTGTTGEELESGEAAASDCIFLRTAVSVLASPSAWVFRLLTQLP
jgi:hypothetical protein